MTAARQRILVVDDQPVNLLVLQDMLEEDWDIATAGDGAAALAYFAGGASADLVLLDVMMPGLNGYDVCSHLKADPRTRDIPVLFLSGLTSFDDEARGLAAGAADFIQKPYSPALVRERVRTHLRLSRALAALAALGAPLPD